jgi:hypothetical protein
MRAGTEVALLLGFALVECLDACTGYESEYEKGVYDYEPVYCYQTIGGVDCHREPRHRDSARLVNYYGPAPAKYDPPERPEESRLQPPPKVKVAYRDPEPAIGPATGEVATREVGERKPAPAGKGETRAGEPAGDEEKSEWKEWLPFVSVAFGALQVVAAFVF